MADEQSSAVTEKPSEDVVAKYKRLLSLARSSLEANQATLATKDKQLHQLVAALEEAKKQQYSRRALGKDEEAALVPRRILCRVDVEDRVWVLIEYEDYDDTWKSFEDAQALEDFIQRVPGVPLTCPQKNLSAEESQMIIDDSKIKVDRVVEEFRRYKVRAEIARKQKDAETRQALMSNNNSSGSNSNLSTMGDVPSGDSSSAVAMQQQLKQQLQSLQQEHADELQRMRAIMKEQEQKWKSSFDKVARENELLRSKGGESLLASQWRGRYETCMREKSDLSEKLRSLTELSSEFPSNAKSIEQAYLEVLDEYKNFRRKVIAFEKKRRSHQSKLEGSITAATVAASAGNYSSNSNSSGSNSSSGGSSGSNSVLSTSDLVALVSEHDQRMKAYDHNNGSDQLDDSHSNNSSNNSSTHHFTALSSASENLKAGGAEIVQTTVPSSSSSAASPSAATNHSNDDFLIFRRNSLTGTHSVLNMHNNGAYSSSNGGGDGSGSGMSEAKLKYLRQMVVRYLSCKEPDVKLHIEQALMSIFRLTEKERKNIEAQRKADSEDTLSSITSFLGETLSTFAP